MARNKVAVILGEDTLAEAGRASARHGRLKPALQIASTLLYLFE